MAKIVHQVAVLKKSAMGAKDWNMISCDKFLEIPNSDRITMLCAGQIKFYDANGAVVSAKDAIGSMTLK